MMTIPWMQTVIVSALAGACIAAAGWLQQVREQFPPPPLAETELYVTSGSFVKRLTTGYNTLAADLYWIRAIQYFGGVRLRLADPAGTQARGETVPTSYDQLYPLLDLTTTLDPYFNIAYRFGAIFLAEPFPSGAGRPDLAVALLEKGLREQPHKWEYMQDIGFVHYWWRQDYAAAAQWFQRAADATGAPWWLASLAAVTLAEGGDRASSRLMWQSILESAEIDWLRRDAERRLQQLQAMDDIDALQAEVDRIAAARGTAIRSWAEILNPNMPGPPADPAGTPYQLTAAGRVRIAPSSPLAPLPDEPRRLPRP